MRERLQIPAFRFATRLNSFKPVAMEQTAAMLIRAAAQVPGLDAVELNFPQHFISQPEPELRRALDDTGLTSTAINLRFEGPRFSYGTLSSPDADARAEAIAIAHGAVDRARAYGADHVILWLSDDGWDYPFQVDYARLWRDAVVGVRTIAEYAASGTKPVRVSIEYKPCDPRRFSLIRGMGDALMLAVDSGMANVGVTLDVCHSLMAGEHPPAAAAQAIARGKLYGMHLNDGYGPADDGLAVASVHSTMTRELLWTLVRGGFAGTLYFDTFPIREDPVQECMANIATVRSMLSEIAQIDPAALDAAQASHDALGTQVIAGSR